MLADDTTLHTSGKYILQTSPDTPCRWSPLTHPADDLPWRALQMISPNTPCRWSPLTRLADDLPWRTLQMVSPDTTNFILGVFNSGNLRSTLPTIKQYVTCSTRLSKTLDLCYGNIPDAYKSESHLPVGTSDHNTIHVIPAYGPKIQAEQVVSKDVKVWSCDSVEQYITLHPPAFHGGSNPHRSQ